MPCSSSAACYLTPMPELWLLVSCNTVSALANTAMTGSVLIRTSQGKYSVHTGGGAARGLPRAVVTIGTLHGGASNVQCRCNAARPGARTDQHAPGRPYRVHVYDDYRISCCSTTAGIKRWAQRGLHYMEIFADGLRSELHAPLLRHLPWSVLQALRAGCAAAGVQPRPVESACWRCPRRGRSLGSAMGVAPLQVPPAAGALASTLACRTLQSPHWRSPHAASCSDVAH